MVESAGDAKAALTGSIVGALIRGRDAMVDPFEDIEVKTDEHGNYQPWVIIRTKSGYEMLISIVHLEGRET